MGKVRAPGQRLLKTVGPGDVTIIQPVSRRLHWTGATRVASLPLLLNSILMPIEGELKAGVSIVKNGVLRMNVADVSIVSTRARRSP